MSVKPLAAPLFKAPVHRFRRTPSSAPFLAAISGRHGDALTLPFALEKATTAALREASTMQSALSLPREMQMPDPTDREPRAPTVQTGIWIEEHGWLHRLFKSPDNTSPRFRFPDLLGACVSLAFRDLPSQGRLTDYLVTQLTLRNPRTERRSCELWAAQFDLVMAAHRAPWNRFPNPMFELDQITTACVAVAMSLPDGDAQILGQARLNLRERAAHSHGPEC